MSHGQAQRPVESNDGRKVQIEGAVGQEELRAHDRDVVEVLDAIHARLGEMRDLLQRILGG